MSQLYHYRGCALPNVYLENGFETQSTPYGKGVTIHDVDGLHDALGHAVVINPSPLTGDEFRFLRQELELSQAALAAIIGRDEQSLARWEKGKTGKVDPAADRLLRIVYHQSKLGNKPFAPALEFLRQLERMQSVTSHSLLARAVGRRWRARPS